MESNQKQSWLNLQMKKKKTRTWRHLDIKGLKAWKKAELHLVERLSSNVLCSVSFISKLLLCLAKCVLISLSSFSTFPVYSDFFLQWNNICQIYTKK